MDSVSHRLMAVLMLLQLDSADSINCQGISNRVLRRVWLQLSRSEPNRAWRGPLVRDGFGFTYSSQRARQQTLYPGNLTQATSSLTALCWAHGTVCWHTVDCALRVVTVCTQVDAFTDKAFGGNPAAVFFLHDQPSDEWMQVHTPGTPHAQTRHATCTDPAQHMHSGCGTMAVAQWLLLCYNAPCICTAVTVLSS